MFVPELRHTKNITMEQVPNHAKGLMDLSNEILELIFLQLSQYDTQRNLALVCRRFLNITRHPKYVQTVQIEPIGKMKNWDQFNCFPEYDFPGSCLKMINKVKTFFPDCNIEFKCLLDKHDNFGKARKTTRTKVQLERYTWMEKFRPHAKSITKLTLKATHNSISAFSNFILFKNLESLDLDLAGIDYGSDEDSDIEQVEEEFWENFPKLKSLRINSNYVTDKYFENNTVSSYNCSFFKS